ncbi:MAG: serpin family protein [Lachnospiraceae bacterium]|nr:serpin family protein [Lachnospiraceae bacterium]
MRKRVLAITLCITMILSLASCGGVTDPQIQSKNLMEELENSEAGKNTVEKVSLADFEGQYPLSDFGVRLMQQTMKASEEGENVLVSPLSVLLALYMTANGAEGQTKDQMLQVLGEDLNGYLKAYREALPQGADYKLNIANSIWFKDKESLNVQENFLLTNRDYFDAALYKAPFNDITCKEINNWVKENTDGMIKNILNEIPQDAVLYLINALSFDAKWTKPYQERSVQEDCIFTKEDGTEQKATLMYSEEHVYLEDEYATGFMKYYKENKYAFVALLPKEGVKVADYVTTLSADGLHQMFSNAKRTVVNARLPKFKTEYNILLNDILIQMGMEDAFSFGDADFSKMAVSDDGNIFISRVLHKTFISVDEQGTKAGAATAVETTDSAMFITESYNVFLDRPFVYMLIDCETNQPFFIGTMMDVEK